MIRIYPPGSEVRMSVGEDGWQQAYIQAARIQLGGVIDYNLIYWKDGERKTAWVESFEVSPMSDGDERTAIVFIKQKGTKA